MNVRNYYLFDFEDFSFLVTLDMYRMLQAVERQAIESSAYDERTNVQSPAPTNYQQRDIYVRIFD